MTTSEIRSTPTVSQRRGPRHRLDRSGRARRLAIAANLKLASVFRAG